MIFRICLLFSAIACHTSTALVFYKSAKVGEKVRLDLGAGYDTWRRERKPGVVEFIKRCAIGEKGPHCTNFVTLDYRIAEPKSIAYVAFKGALVFNPFKATDVGKYSSGMWIGNQTPYISLVLED